MTTSSASATWNGGLKDGNGTFQAKSATFQGPYSFATRFEGAKGTNPEELLAAAHAACLSMALAAGLEKGGTTVASITTTASCTVETVGGGPKITKMKLVVRGRAPGLSASAFAKAAEEAKAGCPVSNALKGIPAVELDALLLE
jgi:osmotically inducible protein OsmC